MQESLPVVMAFDDAYAGYASVAIASLFANASIGAPAVHIITAGISKASMNALLDVSRRFNRKIQIHKIDASLLAWMGGLGYISNATYWRLASAELQMFDRVLYLDADLIVEGDISRLFNMNIGDSLAAGVVDETASGSGQQRLGLPETDPYINAGVLLINAKRWREENIAARCVDFAKRNPERIMYADQDLINAVLCGRKFVLDSRWNVLQIDLTTLHLRSVPRLLSGDYEIFHFNGPIKPWMEWGDTWAQEAFDRYRRFTALRNQPRIQPSGLNEWMVWAATLDAAGDYKKSSEVRNHIIKSLVEILNLTKPPKVL